MISQSFNLLGLILYANINDYLQFWNVKKYIHQFWLIFQDEKSIMNIRLTIPIINFIKIKNY